MKLFCSIVFGILPLVVFGQDHETAIAETTIFGHRELLFVPSADCTAQGGRLAEYDLAKGAPVLLLQSGISPIVYVSDRAFEQKFGVRYFDEGCSSPSKECMVAYNARVFRYLQRNYAKTWWKSIRKDVVGFKDWRKSAKP